MKWLDFRCHVVVDGLKLIEYENPESVDPNGKVTSCWIASPGGKNYEVRMEIVGNQPSLQLRSCLYIDNQHLASRILRKHKKKINVRGLQIHGEAKIRRLKFEPLKSIDGDHDPSRDITELGSIRLTIRQCRISGRRDKYSARKELKQSEFDKEPQVHESHKKGGLHCTSLEDPQPLSVRPALIVNSMPKDYVDEYRHTLIFKYRPFEYLLAKGIVPCHSNSSEKEPLGSQSERDTTCKQEAEEDVVQAEQDEDTEGIRKLEKKKRLLRQECQEHLNDIEEELTRLKAGHSRPRKRVKLELELEYQARLREIDGQVFEISD